jgi:myosin heavy subunit
MALRDQLHESVRQDPARPSSLERVCTALIDRDEALRQACSDLEKMRTLATNWEAEVAGVRNEDRGLRSSLEGAQAQAQQCQAEEWARALEQRAKEANDLKAALDAKVAALATSEGQLLQKRTARQGAEGRLQQEQAALADAQSTLEQERVAREAAQKSLEGRNAELSKVEGELIVLSITSANQELALQEQGETVRGLEQAVEAGRRALEVERKQVEGKSLLDSCFAGFLLEGSHPFSDFFLVLATPGLRTALGHAAERAEALQTSYNSSEQELQELRNATLETCRVVEEGEAQAGSSLASRLHALSGHVAERMRRALHLGVQKALGVVRSHYEVDFEALAEGYVVPEGVEDEVAMERVDARAVDAAGTLAEAFEEFLFPDAADAAAPSA